jgi:hypothetical protein
MRNARFKSAASHASTQFAAMAMKQATIHAHTDNHFVDPLGEFAKKGRRTMYKLYDAGARKMIGMLSDQQLQFLIDHLEEESATDQDYYINVATLDMFENDEADAELLAMLRSAMGERGEMDIRWETETG